MNMYLVRTAFKMLNHLSIKEEYKPTSIDSKTRNFLIRDDYNKKLYFLFVYALSNFKSIV